MLTQRVGAEHKDQQSFAHTAVNSVGDQCGSNTGRAELCLGFIIICTYQFGLGLVQSISKVLVLKSSSTSPRPGGFKVL